MSRIVCTTANFVARETGFAMHGWGHGDRTTNEAYAPLETYGERFDGLLRHIRSLGFETIDLWGSHLSPDWATEQHVSIAQEALETNGIAVATYAGWLHAGNVERCCELTRAVGADTIGAGFSGDPAELAPTLRRFGVCLAIENHPERTPAELLTKIVAGGPDMAATIDTGWWATQGYDPVRAIETLRKHIRHVHLKDVHHAGDPHETCIWGEGVVNVRGCVDALRRVGYEGTLTVEDEPEDRDPSDGLRAMRERLERWLS